MDLFRNGTDRKWLRKHIFVFFNVQTLAILSARICNIFSEPVLLHVSCLAYLACVVLGFKILIRANGGEETRRAPQALFFS